MQVPLPFAGYPSPQMQYFSAYELKPVSGQADPVLLAWIVWSYAALSIRQNWRVTFADMLAIPAG